MKKPLALCLISEDALKQTISSLLPDYEFHWGLDLTGAINTASDLRPSVLLVDIDDDSVPWAAIIQGLKTSPATRRIPMLGVGKNVTGEKGSQAVAAGVTGVMGRDDLALRLQEWVKRHARVWDENYYAALSRGCQQPLPELAREGIRLFNQRDYWEAHEVLEHAWIEAQGQPIGEVYRAILQVGVAYYQIQRGNYRGALKMFLRSVQWLDPLPDECQGINVAQFKADAAAARAALESLGAERIAEFEQEKYFKPVPGNFFEK